MFFFLDEKVTKNQGRYLMTHILSMIKCVFFACSASEMLVYSICYYLRFPP